MTIPEDEGHSALTAYVLEALTRAGISQDYIDEIITLIIEAEYERASPKR